MEEWKFETSAAQRGPALKKTLERAARLFELIESDPAARNN